MSSSRFIDLPFSKEELESFFSFVESLTPSDLLSPERRSETAEVLQHCLGQKFVDLHQGLYRDNLGGVVSSIPSDSEWSMLWFSIALATAVGSPSISKRGHIHEIQSKRFEPIFAPELASFSEQGPVELHTDDVPLSPDGLGLGFVFGLCLKLKDAWGGDSTFLHLHDVADWQRWALDPIGHSGFLRRVRGNLKVVEWEEPIFETKFCPPQPGDSQPHLQASIFYNRSLMHPANEEQRQFLDGLDLALNSCTARFERLLSTGSFFLINNSQALHGRKGFHVGPNFHRDFVRIRGELNKPVAF